MEWRGYSLFLGVDVSTKSRYGSTGGHTGWPKTTTITSISFFKRLIFDKLSAESHALRPTCDSPRTIKESVPRVKDAFLPTARVESIAKEFPRPGSSREVVGSTNGLSIATEFVVMS